MTSTPSASAQDTAHGFPPATHLFSRFCAFLSKACLLLAIVGLLCLVLAVQTQVIGRYVFNAVSYTHLTLPTILRV